MLDNTVHLITLHSSFNLHNTFWIFKTQRIIEVKEKPIQLCLNKNKLIILM